MLTWLVEELQTDFIFIEKQGKVKKSNFSLHETSIDITQNVAGTNYTYYYYYYYYYYYWYSALGPVWAETRVQSGDWYGSGTLHPGQVLRGSLPLLSPFFLDVPTFHHKVPPRPPRRERSRRRKWELWARMLSGNFCWNDDFHAI